MNDLSNAPPAFHDRDGRRYVYVDLKAAIYDLKLDVKNAIITVNTELDFVTKQSGFPILDFSI